MKQIIEANIDDIDQRAGLMTRFYHEPDMDLDRSWTCRVSKIFVTNLPSDVETWLICFDGESRGYLDRERRFYSRIPALRSRKPANLYGLMTAKQPVTKVARNTAITRFHVRSYAVQAQWLRLYAVSADRNDFDFSFALIRVLLRTQ